jgi:pimeloyl-ACP methyl ester carboxylesterase
MIVELEGHGATPLRDRPLRIESFADAVLAAMDGANVGPADVFGYSMGGYIALYLAATSPDRVQRVATLATKLAWTPEVAARECALLDPQRFGPRCRSSRRRSRLGTLARVGRRCSRVQRTSFESSGRDR